MENKKKPILCRARGKIELSPLSTSLNEVLALLMEIVLLLLFVVVLKRLSKVVPSGNALK